MTSPYITFIRNCNVHLLSVNVLLNRFWSRVRSSLRMGYIKNVPLSSFLASKDYKHVSCSSTEQKDWFSQCQVYHSASSLIQQKHNTVPADMHLYISMITKHKNSISSYIFPLPKSIVPILVKMKNAQHLPKIKKTNSKSLLRQQSKPLFKPLNIAYFTTNLGFSSAPLFYVPTHVIHHWKANVLEIWMMYANSRYNHNCRHS